MINVARRWQRISALLVLVGFAGMLGCGSGGPGKVVGTVSVKGKKLNSGTLHFTGSDGKAKSAGITQSGQYELHDPPLGQVTVTVEGIAGAGFASKPGVGVPKNHKPAGPPDGGTPVAGLAAPIPVDPRYKDAKNGEVVKIAGGTSKLDIEFTK